MVALGAALFLLGGSPAWAGDDPGDPQPLPGEAWITGVTLADGVGVDDLIVEAYKAGRAGHEPVASDLTYANPDDSHPHGYYRLAVEPGSYVIRFSSFDDDFETRWYGDKQVVTVRDQQVKWLGSVTMSAPPADSETECALTDAVVRPDQRPTIRVRVKSPGTPRVTGRISVALNGHRVDTERLSSGDRGRVVLRLPRQRPGSYRVVVTYAGSETVAHSRSQVRTLRVVKGGGHHHGHRLVLRPNAAW
ncbi:Ig-like domain-containing protein [Nocardioides sp.]|uniref:Ig-like domain-containing protein n=1 Tax=Nocardioides sp. TaxID=35761 RepID=UPI0031FF3AC5